VNPADAIASGFKKSFQFSGHATRSEFWWFTAFAALLGLVAAGLDWSLFTAKAYSAADRELIMLRTNHEAARLVGLIILVPIIAVSALWVVHAALAALSIFVMVWSGHFISGRGSVDLRLPQDGTIRATQLGFFLCFIAPLLPILFPIWLHLKPAKQIKMNPPEVPS
jgi:uncharacterized membrane protein YhaH (DUF805 family)